MKRSRTRYNIRFGIKNKLQAAFIVQLIIILILGNFIYKKSEEIIIKNFEKSTLTTLDVISDHFSYMLGTLESRVFEYAIRDDVKDYVTGFLNDPLKKFPLKEN